MHGETLKYCYTFRRKSATVTELYTNI